MLQARKQRNPRGRQLPQLMVKLGPLRHLPGRNDERHELCAASANADPQQVMFARKEAGSKLGGKKKLLKPLAREAGGAGVVEKSKAAQRRAHSKTLREETRRSGG